MGRVVFLGVASAYPRRDSDPTSFALEDAEGHVLLVDCGGNPPARLLAAGIAPTRVGAVFLTHNHADHLAGFPLLVHGLEMMGHRELVEVRGPGSALSSAQALLEALGMGEREVFPLVWEELPETEWSEFNAGSLGLVSFPVNHSRPTLGLAVSEGATGSSNPPALVYSSDTGPSPELMRAARGTRILIHECSLLEEEDYPYHTSPEELAMIGEATRPGLLVIVHTPPIAWGEKERIIAAIRRQYAGRIDFAEPFRSYTF